MKQRFFDDILTNGIVLDDKEFQDIVSPCFVEKEIKKPDTIWLPMRLSDGCACKVTVNIGDYIPKYGIVGKTEGKLLEDYHVVRSDVAGYVTAIREKLIGYKQYEQYVELRICDNQAPTAMDCIEKIDWREAHLMHALANSSIPNVNHILYTKNQKRECRRLVLNAIVDEPSILNELQMIKEQPGEILYGLLIFLQILHGKEILIVTSQRCKQAMQSLILAAQRYFDKAFRSKISVIFLPNVYPTKPTQLLASYVEEMEEATVVDIYQAVAAYQMIYEQKPYTNCTVFVGGYLPINGIYHLPIGTKLADIFPLKKYLKDRWFLKFGILVDGGLMAGKTCNPEEVIVHENMHSLLMLPRIEEHEMECRSCERCRNVCPVGIVPFKNDGKDYKHCLNCGNCSFVCPSRRRLCEFVRRGGRKKILEGGHYIEVPKSLKKLESALVTGYASPYIRATKSPFACILSPFKL